MKIELSDVGQRFKRDWIFKGVNTTFEAKSKWAILGGNGSGKSTLLSLISGKRIPSKGKINYSIDGKSIEQEAVYTHLSLASPSLELYEEFTLAETINFHFTFKQSIGNLTTEAIATEMYLQDALGKQVKFFSSGMKQRLKVGLALLSAGELLLLDEPTMNMDAKAIDWYGTNMEKYAIGKTVVISSNSIAHEYQLCSNQIDIEQFKH